MSAALLIAGCASSSKDIGAAYVSPIQYAGFTCDQIREEQARVTTRAMQLAGQVDDNATGDAVAMGVGVLLFWPALFFIDGDGPEANEYARLKGEREALDQAAIRKDCGFPVSDPPEIAAEEEPAESVNTIMDADDPR
ncbi:hypothetical protein [Roseospira navarrensis]|uniref:hypothetical protein n=1 Tax=Roseospira navarrensis TaxID=140058 RepID=UPI001B87355D|nr:hypothetical protein [Roseospira navarrensis]